MSSKRALAHEIGLIAANAEARSCVGRTPLDLGRDIAVAYIAATDEAMSLAYIGDSASLLETITYKLVQWARR